MSSVARAIRACSRSRRLRCRSSCLVACVSRALDGRPVLLDRFCRRMVTGTSMGTASHQDADLLVTSGSSSGMDRCRAGCSPVSATHNRCAAPVSCSAIHRAAWRNAAARVGAPVRAALSRLRLRVSAVTASSATARSRSTVGGRVPARTYQWSSPCQWVRCRARHSAAGSPVSSGGGMSSAVAPWSIRALIRAPSRMRSSSSISGPSRVSWLTKRLRYSLMASLRRPNPASSSPPAPRTCRSVIRPMYRCASPVNRSWAVKRPSSIA